MTKRADGTAQALVLCDSFFTTQKLDYNEPVADFTYPENPRELGVGPGRYAAGRMLYALLHLEGPDYCEYISSSMSTKSTPPARRFSWPARHLISQHTTDWRP